MAKAYTLEQLGGMTLKELAALVNIPAIVKMAKGPAAIRAFNALPDVPEEQAAKPKELGAAPKRTWIWPTTETTAKAAAEAAKKENAGKYRATSKFGKLYAALGELRTRADLLEATGFDMKNLSVAMSIMKRDGYVIKTMVEADKTYKYQLATAPTAAA